MAYVGATGKGGGVMKYDFKKAKQFIDERELKKEFWKILCVKYQGDRDEKQESKSMRHITGS